MNETNLQFELAKKEQEKVAAAVQKSSVKKDETNRQIEQPKTGLIKSIVKVSELRLKVEKSERDEKGRAEEAANLARRVQREKDLQKKEARPRPPPRVASTPNNHIVRIVYLLCHRMCSLPVRHLTITIRQSRRQTTSNSG